MGNKTAMKKIRIHLNDRNYSTLNDNHIFSIQPRTRREAVLYVLAFGNSNIIATSVHIHSIAVPVQFAE